MFPQIQRAAPSQLLHCFVICLLCWIHAQTHHSTGRLVSFVLIICQGCCHYFCCFNVLLNVIPSTPACVKLTCFSRSALTICSKLSKTLCLLRSIHSHLHCLFCLVVAKRCIKESVKLPQTMSKNMSTNAHAGLLQLHTYRHVCFVIFRPLIGCLPACAHLLDTGCITIMVGMIQPTTYLVVYVTHNFCHPSRRCMN